MKTKIINRVAALGLLLLVTWTVTPVSAGSAAVQQSCPAFANSLVAACEAAGKSPLNLSTPLEAIVACGPPPTTDFDSVCSAGGGILENVPLIGNLCIKLCDA
jgi:hypothetical protein